VNKLIRSMVSCSFSIVMLFAAFAASAGAQELALETKSLVGEGWHNWYEIKSDPENQKNLILCGTRSDAMSNAFFGFIYSSTDGGSTWRLVLEDRNSTWVTEQSCAFGAEHRAYFISEASKVFDGEAHHDYGTTRLYLSSDGGRSWKETLKTAWADHSTSAVSGTTGRLYTFYNPGPNTVDHGQNLGSTIGLLVFSPDGKNVAGPVLSSAIQERDYYGIYPWGATALKSGTVVAFYHAFAAPPLQESDLGIIRADRSANQSLDSTVISHTVFGKDCRYDDKASLTYNLEANRLFLLYGDGCKNRNVMLTSSDDEGKTWTKPVVLSGPGSGHVIYTPSLAAGPRGDLGLLWRDGEHAGRWLFSIIRDQKLVEPEIELSNDPENIQVSSDSLWDGITQANGFHGQTAASEPSITLNVHSALNNVMSVFRANGVIAVGGKYLVVWPAGSSNGMQLYTGMLGSARRVEKKADSSNSQASDVGDVTNQSMLLYGGSQTFDSPTGTLEVCVIVANRGQKSIRVPIRLEVTGLKSSIGAISILNASNGLTGAGAIWDISHSITGDQIPIRSQSNPYCLNFHVEVPPNRISLEDPDLLNLKVRVLASGSDHAESEH
jgi:hypothetical protein